MRVIIGERVVDVRKDVADALRVDDNPEGVNQYNGGGGGGESGGGGGSSGKGGKGEVKPNINAHPSSKAYKAAKKERDERHAKQASEQAAHARAAFEARQTQSSQPAAKAPERSAQETERLLQQQHGYSRSPVTAIRETREHAFNKGRR